MDINDQKYETRYRKSYRNQIIEYERKSTEIIRVLFIIPIL